jgi:iron-sulfur cluster assembly accessory protein
MNESKEVIMSVTLTEAAAKKAASLVTQEGRDDLRLRLAAAAGGCAGLRYQLFFTPDVLDGDETTEYDGIDLVVDKMSKIYLDGAIIDFVDKIDQQGFKITNPNAQNTCGCGDSFS